MIFLRYVILFALFLSTGSSVRSLDWCAYWRGLKQDHLRPECNGIYRIRFSRVRDEGLSRGLPELRGDLIQGFHRYRAEVNGVTSLTKRVLGIDECVSSYSFCRSSTICESEVVCLSDGGYCCIPKKRYPQQCPSPDELTPNCRINRPVNWCTSAAHCGFQKLCCPTQCGYNICV